MTQSALRLEQTERKSIRNRLARARGQLEAVIKQIDQDAACLEVIPQMIAANKAMDRATYAMMLAALENCSTRPGNTKQAQAETQALRKLFLSLS